MIGAVRLAIGLAAMAMLTACAAGPPAGVDPLGAVPADLSLDVAVLSKAGTVVEEEGPAAPPEAYLRASRYILFPDGSLCYGADPDGRLGVNWVPPIARILTRREMAEVWALAQQFGFANPQHGDPIINFKLVTPQRGERIYLVGFAGSEHRWNVIRRAPIDQPVDAAMAQFIQHLARLAWADEPDSNARFMPRRYDFGPDPYARYRTPVLEK